MTVSKCTSFISSRTQEIFRTFFFWFGVRIYRKPWVFILIGTLITICTSSYIFIGYNEEVRNFYLWVPQKSDIWAKFENIKKEYGISPKMTLLLTMNDQSESILSPKNMDLTYKIFNEINNIKINEFTYNDLCLRPFPTAPFCISDHSNIFGFFFSSNPLLWQNDTNIYNRINTGGSNSPIYGFAGGIQLDNMQFVYSANALLFIYELRGSINKEESDLIYEYMGEFQEYWSVHKNDYDHINIEYSTYRSLDDEVSRVIIGDFHIMASAIVVMAIYLMITLGLFHRIQARPWLAGSAILVLISSMGVGFGISFMLGTTVNIICVFVAYILLGVGVDDMIIIVDKYESLREFAIDDEMRVARTLSETGLAISLTSLCTTMAFTIGATTDLPAICAFCTFAAWSFFANYILQFLVFVPFMVYDNKRIAKGNNFCCPCCIHHDIEQGETQTVTLQNASDSEDENENDNKFKKCNIMKLCIIPLLSKRITRWIIIFIFTFILYGSIYVSFFISTESDDTKLVPDDSYMIDYLDAYEDNFGDVLITDLNIVIHNQDFSDVNVRSKTYDFIDALNSDPKAIGKVYHWLDAFANWTISQTNLTDINDLKDFDQFYNYLESFCDDTRYIQWHSEICYNDFHNNYKRTGITSTRFFLTVSKSAIRSKQWDEYLHWNGLCNKYFGADKCYIFEPENTFAYLVSSIQRITIENMIYAALGVFGILCLFLDLRMACFCLLMVVMIDIDLFGWMWLLNISLDVVSYTELVMAAGLTVDYVLHIVHAITDHADDNREQEDKYEDRIDSVMSQIGTSVLKGAFTTFLGAVALVFSQSEAFRIFFFMFVGIIIIALLHSILLVPALLGEFKFIYKGIPNSNIRKAYSAVDSTSYMTDTSRLQITRLPMDGISEEDGEDDDEFEFEQPNDTGFATHFSVTTPMTTPME